MHIDLDKNKRVKYLGGRIPVWALSLVRLTARRMKKQQPASKESSNKPDASAASSVIVGYSR